MITYQFMIKIKKITKAFSLIELSIVLLIIGILVAGVTQSSRLIRQMKLSSAQSITRGSPVPTITGLIAWYETTSPDIFSTGSTNFNDLERPDNNQQINRWKDLNPLLTESYRNHAVQTNVAFQPSYIDNAINGLPAINFNNNLLVSTVNNGDVLAMTIFAVFYTNSDLATHQGIVITDGNWVSNSFTYTIHNANYFYYRTAGVYGLNSSASIPLKTPTLTQLIDDGKGNIRLYTSGQNMISVNVLTPAKSLNLFDIGGWWVGGVSGGESLSGGIGEIIIFSRALNEEERKAVESYLAKKWAIKV